MDDRKPSEMVFSVNIEWVAEDRAYLATSEDIKGLVIRAENLPDMMQSLTELVPTGDRIYLLRVRGKSMIEDHIDDGDLVVVERRETANDGDIVVAILEDEEATLKRFYRESNGMIRLQPANSEMEPLFTNRVQLRGVVRGVIRKFR